MTVDDTTLDVAYTNLTKRVEDSEEASTTLQTELEVVQGQISSKVWQTDITEITDPIGQRTTTLEDQYSQINQDVNGITVEIENLQTSVSDNYETLDNKITSVSATADGIRSEVSAVNTKVDNLEIGSRNYIRNSKTLTYDSYSFVARGDDTTAYVGSAIVGTNTADGTIITADTLNSIETSTQNTSTAVDGVKATMGI